jgi:leader peptidase (prepilin peptidase)/N-methyltransferase
MMFDRQTWAAMPFHFWSVVFFVFGSIVGSFLNVCIHRLPRGLSLVHPPSHCPQCGYQIPWHLNMPLVTWLVLRGRCAHCGAGIAFRYFLVELATAVLFLAAWGHAGPISFGLAVAECVLLAGLIVATCIDFEHYIIPDEITLGGVGTGLLCSLLVPALQTAPSAFAALKQSLLGLVFGGGIIYLTVLLGKYFFGRKTHELAPNSTVVFGENGLQLPDEEVPYEDIFYRKTDTVVLEAKTAVLADKTYELVQVRLNPTLLQVGPDQYHPLEVPRLEVVTDAITIPREAMGMGDVKFMAAIGAFLGWTGVLFSMIFSAFLGALGGGLMIFYHVLRKDHYSTRIPYGPCIAAAAAVWLFFRQPILSWWLQFNPAILW